MNILDRWRARKARRALQCRVTEEWQGAFIGRQHCHRHNIVWDDGGDCPRKGQRTGQPFVFAYHLDAGRY